MTQMTVTNIPYVQTQRAQLPQASLRDTLGLISTVVLPTVAKGVIIRRPSVVALAEWLDLDQRAVRLQPPNRRDARQALPGTLNNYSLHVELDRY